MIWLIPMSTAGFALGIPLCKYTARASSGLAVFDCAVMNASAVSAWDTGFTRSFDPLEKTGGQGAGLRAIKMD